METDEHKRKYTILKTGSTLLLLVFAFLLVNCTPNKPEEIQAITNREELPAISFKELDAVATDSGKLRNRLIASELHQYDMREDPIIDFPRGLHFFSYNNNGEIESQIKSNTAVYYQKKELWELRNSVEAVNAKGDVLNTELLFWDTKKKRIYSDQYVKMTTADDIYTGYGFESDESMEVYTIKKFSGTIEVEETPAKQEENTDISPVEAP
ncbi:MAG: LPS export ABC transporter periplasmic protein LptC [Cytophagaceae bacterium]|jgi:LPS export ABC transporter protein LptC|nr:LPS export ABC transporter periplasmic protein LptC [Cytophagaceae bacterium]